MSLTLRLPVAGEDCLAECCKGQAAKDLCINGSERWLLKYPADCHRVRARARTKNHVGSGLTKATGTGLGDRWPCSLNTGWSGRGEAAEVAGASPPTPHLPDLLRKMRIGCLETGRHEELCVPERLHSDVGIVGSSWDRIYGRVGHARPTVWGSTMELGREGEAGGRGGKPSVCGKDVLATPAVGQTGRAPEHTQAVGSGPLASLTPPPPQK